MSSDYEKTNHPPPYERMSTEVQPNPGPPTGHQDGHGLTVQVSEVEVDVGDSGRQRVLCAYCQQTFLTIYFGSHLARCPHCCKVSSVGKEFIHTRGTIFFVIGLFFLIAGVFVTVYTYEMAKEKGGIYLVWVGAFVVGVITIVRGLVYFCAYKVSYPME